MMEIQIKLLLFVSSISSTFCCEPSITTVSGLHAGKSFCAGAKIFEDNFNSLDQKKWKHEVTLAGGGNWEFQWYVNDRTNSFAKGGNLHLRTTLTADIFGEAFLTKGHVKIPKDQCTQAEFYGCERQGSPDHIINPIRSARVSTMNSFAFKFGTLEVRAKMPSGDWLWPAIWMMPQKSVYGGWPRSGEIDLAELRGNKKLFAGNTNVGTEQVGSTMHFGPRWDINGWATAHHTKNKVPGFNEAFHLYKVVWGPKQIKFLIDNEVILTVDAGAGFWKRGHFERSGLPNPWTRGTIMAPFDQQFYIILNLAAGGTNYFSDSFKNQPYPKPWKNNSPRAAADFWRGKNHWLPTWNLKRNDQADLIVDYVRVWAL